MRAMIRIRVLCPVQRLLLLLRHGRRYICSIDLRRNGKWRLRAEDVLRRARRQLDTRGRRAHPSISSKHHPAARTARVVATINIPICIDGIAVRIVRNDPTLSGKQPLIGNVRKPIVPARLLHERLLVPDNNEPATSTGKQDVKTSAIGQEPDVSLRGASYGGT